MPSLILIFTASEYRQIMSTLGNTGGFAGNDFSRIVRAEDPVAFHLSATLKVFVGVGVGVGDGDGTGAAVDVEDGVGVGEGITDGIGDAVAVGAE
jgi:hypothetical protein